MKKILIIIAILALALSLSFCQPPKTEETTEDPVYAFTANINGKVQYYSSRDGKWSGDIATLGSNTNVWDLFLDHTNIAETTKAEQSAATVYVGGSVEKTIVTAYEKSNFWTGTTSSGDWANYTGSPITGSHEIRFIAKGTDNVIYFIVQTATSYYLAKCTGTTTGESIVEIKPLEGTQGYTNFQIHTMKSTEKGFVILTSGTYTDNVSYIMVYENSGTAYKFKKTGTAGKTFFFLDIVYSDGKYILAGSEDNKAGYYTLNATDATPTDGKALTFTTVDAAQNLIYSIVAKDKKLTCLTFNTTTNATKVHTVDGTTIKEETYTSPKANGTNYYVDLAEDNTSVYMLSQCNYKDATGKDAYAIYIWKDGVNQEIDTTGLTLTGNVFGLTDNTQFSANLACSNPLN